MTWLLDGIKGFVDDVWAHSTLFAVLLVFGQVYKAAWHLEKIHEKTDQIHELLQRIFPQRRD